MFGSVSPVILTPINLLRHYPVGLLYDIYTATYLGTPSSSLPWPLTVRFQNFPADKLIRGQAMDSTQDFFMSMVKEVRFWNWRICELVEISVFKIRIVRTREEIFDSGQWWLKVIDPNTNYLPTRPTTSAMALPRKWWTCPNMIRRSFGTAYGRVSVQLLFIYLLFLDSLKNAML